MANGVGDEAAQQGGETTTGRESLPTPSSSAAVQEAFPTQPAPIPATGLALSSDSQAHLVKPRISRFFQMLRWLRRDAKEKVDVVGRGQVFSSSAGKRRERE